MSLYDDAGLDPAVLQKSFRSAMGNVAAAVSVVTTFHDGAPHGSTVSAFSSLSMDPPMLLISLDNRSKLLAKLDVGSRIGVNVLSDQQVKVAQRFARRGEDKFLDVPWQLENGAPALTERHAWVALTIARLVVAGDHTLVLGDVEAADASSSTGALTYWQRTFGSHQTS